MRLTLRNRLLPCLLLALLPWILLLAAIRLVPLPARLATPGSTVLRYQDGSTAHVFLAPDDRWRVPVGVEDVDPDYIRALVSLEDRRFWFHPGVDPLAVLRATISNLTRGEVVSGASTLTMQLVRVLEPRPRTLRSKAIESLRALHIELCLSKSEILAAYLTFTPYGRNLEGVEAASLSYFGHSADLLSPDEIATLLAVPQDPNRRYPRPDHDETLRSARDGIATRLVTDGILREDCRRRDAECRDRILRRALDAAVPTKLRPFPREVEHAARWLARRNPTFTRIPSTLDRSVQDLVNRRLSLVEREFTRNGVHNVAVVVVDHATAEVAALVGNLDFWDAAHGGQIIAFDTPRSPGSALKPFIYGAAIDRGIALPDFLVPDIPVQFGSYAPRNYDGGFSGLVRLQDALSQSLNIPFVTLLRRVGTDDFLGTLKGAGVAGLRNEPGHYGLSVAAGGIELTPLELAGLYVALAHRGLYRPLACLTMPEVAMGVADPRADPDESRSIPEGSPLLSPGAAWLARQALSIRDRPDFPERRALSHLPRAIHWKTGTSFGHRDAWAVGSGPRHTALIWTGNVDNSASTALVGASTAAPLLFDILEALDDRTVPPPADPPPPDLVPVEVCAYSGRLPGPACEKLRTVLASQRQVPTERCPYHVRMDIDLDSGLALLPACREGHRFASRSFLVWPASVRRWIRDQNRQLPSPPDLAPGCQGAGGSLEIVSPPEGQVVMLVPGITPDRQDIPLEADADRPGTHLSWFVDGTFVGTCDAAERLWWTPRVGTHQVVVVADGGESRTRTLEVRNRPG